MISDSTFDPADPEEAKARKAREDQEDEDRNLDEEEDIARQHLSEGDRRRWEAMSDREREAEIRWATNHGG